MMKREYPVIEMNLMNGIDERHRINPRFKVMGKGRKPHREVLAMSENPNDLAQAIIMTVDLEDPTGLIAHCHAMMKERTGLPPQIHCVYEAVHNALMAMIESRIPPGAPEAMHRKPVPWGAMSTKKSNDLARAGAIMPSKPGSGRDKIAALVKKWNNQEGDVDGEKDPSNVAVPIIPLPDLIEHPEWMREFHEELIAEKPIYDERPPWMRFGIEGENDEQAARDFIAKLPDGLANPWADGTIALDDWIGDRATNDLYGWHPADASPEDLEALRYRSPNRFYSMKMLDEEWALNQAQAVVASKPESKEPSATVNEKELADFFKRLDGLE